MRKCLCQFARYLRFTSGSAVALFLLIGCASNPIDQIDLMPAPDVYGDGMLDPLPDESPFTGIPYRGILYATDRQPAGPDDPEKYYLNDRGFVLRLGVANIQVGDKLLEWDIARKVSLLKSRTDKYPLKVSAATEWGMLASTVPFFSEGSGFDDEVPPPDATQRYADAINAQLSRSKQKQVFIYVHGYKVVYENPILVAAELWHFLGYDGVFIAYAWPSTPSSFAYLKDSDTSQGFARNLRKLIEFLAEETDVEKIHILGYSNGTRLVSRALEQLALKTHDQTPEEIHRQLHIGNVILVGSDIDRSVFGSYLADGVLNVSQRLTIYMSKYDKALGMSQFLTRRDRLGQMFADGQMSKSARTLLSEYSDQISVINVTDAEGAGTGNGHGYFRNSPWASSDVLMTLAYGLSPAERGLVAQADMPVYAFPPDYVERLWDALATVDPQFAETYSEYKSSGKLPAPDFRD